MFLILQLLCDIFPRFTFSKGVGLNKISLMEFYHSGVYFCYLKCGTSVFRKPDNCCLCSSGRITKSLIIFARETDSLVKYSVIFQILG